MTTTSLHFRQRGMVLILSLIMLVVLTLLAISAIRLSTVNLRAVANSQVRSEAMSAAQRTIDSILSGNFTDNIAGTATPPGSPLIVTEGGKDYKIQVARPCLVSLAPIKNIDLDLAIDEDRRCVDTVSNPYSACAHTVWQLEANASSGWFGANVTITQGTGIKMDNSTATVYANDTSYRCPDL